MMIKVSFSLFISAQLHCSVNADAAVCLQIKLWQIDKQRLSAAVLQQEYNVKPNSSEFKTNKMNQI